MGAFFRRAHEHDLALIFSLLAIALAASVGLFENKPMLAIAAVLALPLFVILAGSAWMRLLWFVLGGMIVFQLPDGANSLKLAYLAGVLACAAFAGLRLARTRASWHRPLRVLIPAMVTVALVLCAGVFIGLTEATTSNAIRDALPYLLLVLGPLIAVDAAADVSSRTLYTLAGLVGFAAAIGFMTDWLHRRGVSSLPFGRVLLATWALGVLGLAVALVQVAATTGAQRLAWMGIACMIPVGYLITGTRTSVVLVVVILGVAGAKSKSRLPLGRLLGAIALMALTLVIVLPRLATLVVSDPTFLSRRLRSLLQLASAASQDQSGQERRQAYAWTFQIWKAHFLMGTGPGYIYPNGSFSLDSPLTTFTKWGLIGGMSFVLLLVAVGLASRSITLTYGFSPASTVCRGFLVCVVALTPLTSPLEDKGFALALALLVAIMSSTARERSTVSEPMGADLPRPTPQQIDPPGRTPRSAQNGLAGAVQARLT